MLTVSDAVLLSVGHVTVTVTGTLPSCCGAVQIVDRSAGCATVPIGAVHPSVTEQRVDPCTVSRRVPGGGFSVDEESGARLRSAPTIAVVMAAVSFDGTWPFSSPSTRRTLRDGNVKPVPHRNAPVGISKPSGLPRNS